MVISLRLLTPHNLAGVGRRRPNRAAETHRVHATGNCLGRDWVLRTARAEPRLWVVELDQMVVRMNVGDEVCNGRSSTVLEFNPKVFGRRSWWWLRVRGKVLSTLVSSDTGCNDCGRDCVIAGGEELTAPAELRPRHGK